MLLGNLLKSISKNHQKIPVNGISFDSRKTKKGNIFFAIKGNKNSGIKFINKAILKGASVIIVGETIKYNRSKVPLIQVKDARKSLSEASSNMYKKKPQNIIAVTGTNGKSSVADFFYQLLTLNKVKVASIGTLGLFSKKYNKKLNLTTMDPLSLHKNLQILASKKIKNVILEASSHGLDQKRLDSLKINTGIFTNLSHDHLDYHKNIKSYLNSKMYLFKNLLSKSSKIITDEDNKEFRVIKNIAYKRKLKKITIGSKSGNIKIIYNKYKKDKQIVKIIFKSKIFILEIPLIGYFQIKNLLMATLAAYDCGLKPKQIFNKISKIKPVPGRLEQITNLKSEYKIIVDFAHTSDALEQSLIALKKQFKKEIVIVFGCGGNRDKKKRFTMGSIAKKYCKKIIVTDDNPRYEDPKKIRKTILKGCKNIGIEIGDRKKAIEFAIQKLRPSEILLVAGKGHEKTQDYGNKIVNFSDKKIIKDAIYKNKFFNQKSLLSDIFHKKYLKNTNYSGVSINTKTIKKNEIFFAIKGKNNDGHKFAQQAIKKGALKIVASKGIKKVSRSKIIKVKNTFSSLNNLANITRKNTSAKIIGITGSTGKTTLKNLVSFALQNYGKVYHSPHSFNNKFGVPLSLCNLKRSTEYGVFEIGMDKKGEIDYLSKIVRPNLAVITNISEAHFKNFKTLKHIAAAKAEIIKNIEKDGNIILNKDDSFFNFFSTKAKKRGINIISFSLKKNADIFLKSITKVKNYYKLKINVKNKIFLFNSKYSTKNFISNLLACISVLYALNLVLKKVNKIFVNFLIPDGRGDIKIVKKFKKTFKLVDESYNANPLSMSSSLQNMSYHRREKNLKKIAFLGDMMELGKKSKKLHKELSSVINKSDVDKIFVYGKHIKETFNYLHNKKKGKIFKNLNEAYDYFSKFIQNNDILMIKGSNATGLNQFSKNIKKG